MYNHRCELILFTYTGIATLAGEGDAFEVKTGKVPSD